MARQCLSLLASPPKLLSANAKLWHCQAAGAAARTPQCVLQQQCLLAHGSVAVLQRLQCSSPVMACAVQRAALSAGHEEAPSAKGGSDAMAQVRVVCSQCVASFLAVIVREVPAHLVTTVLINA